jgi:hypothetical protein
LHPRCHHPPAAARRRGRAAAQVHCTRAVTFCASLYIGITSDSSSCAWCLLMPGTSRAGHGRACSSNTAPRACDTDKFRGTLASSHLRPLHTHCSGSQRNARGRAPCKRARGSPGAAARPSGARK